MQFLITDLKTRAPLSLPSLKNVFVTLTSLILLFVIFFPFLLSAKGGTDFGHYLEWASALSSLDIKSISSGTLSPNLLPLSQWSLGPGLILSIGLFLNSFMGPLYIGWILNVVFWIVFAKVLLRASGGKVHLAMFGLLLSFIGTPVGYYSSAYSSESMSFTCLATILFCSMLNWEEFRIRNCLNLGIFSCFLVIIRPQLVIYCIPAYLWLYRCAFWHYRKNASDSSAPGTGQLVVGLALAHLIVITGLVCAGFNNFWMTGSALKSPYSFGSGEFRSLDFSHPNLLAILFHPFHGLLSNHPLFLLLALSGLMVLVRIKRRDLRLHCLLVAAAILIHFYIHAAWYCWWLGTATFGMRGLSLVAIPLVPCLIYLLHQRESEGKTNLWILAGALVACSWSFLLLLQGEAENYTLDSLLACAGNSLNMLSVHLPGTIAAAATTVFFVLKSGVCSRRSEACILSALMWMVIIHLANLMTPKVGLNANLTLAVMGFFPIIVMKSAQIVKGARWGIIAAIVPLVFFLACSFSFARFALAVQNCMQERSVNVSIYPYISSMDLDETSACYDEYLKIPGFQEDKRRLATYLQYQAQRSRNRFYSASN